MATRKNTSDSPDPSPPVRAVTMTRRVVHNDKILEPGDPCPVTGVVLERWKRHGWVG